MRRSLLVTATAAVLVVAGLTACSGTTEGSGTPAATSSGPTAPFQDLPDPVLTAGVSVDGVDPCSVFDHDIVTGYLDADDSRTEQTDLGPSCVFTSAGRTLWTLTFATQSLEAFAEAEGGVNVAVGAASSRVVDHGSSCEVAVALTDDSTLQVLWADQDAGDGCRKTNVVASQALLNLTRR